jgi:hypothetical protein
MEGYSKPYKASYMGKGMSIKDNTHASDVKSINTNTEQYDLGKVKKLKSNSQGYPSEAFNYKY